MSDVHQEILEQIRKVKSTELIVVKEESCGFPVKLLEASCYVKCSTVWIMDRFTMRIYTYSFNSRISDDELEDTFTQFVEKLNVVRNLNYPAK